MKVWLGGLARRWAGAVLVGLAAWLAPGLALANTCAPAQSAGTAPSDFRNYCWLDFSGYSDTAARGGGQNYTFNLPDGSTLSMTVSTTLSAISGVNGYYSCRGHGPHQTCSYVPPDLSGYTAINASPVPTWSGAAFGNVAFLGIPGLPVLYEATQGSSVTVTLSNITVTPPAAGHGVGLAAYSMIVGDGESTNSGESLTYTTNGSGWKQLSQIPNGAYYPSLSGVGTTTVTETGTQTGNSGSYVFGSFNNPTTISFSMVGSGLQGVVVGIRYAAISVVSQFAGPRINPADQITYSLKAIDGSVIEQNSTSGTAQSGFAPASIPTITASYPFELYENMAAGSVDTLASYDISLSCVNNSTTGSSTVLPTNVQANQFTIPSLQYGDAIVCTFTNTPLAYPTITGSVYNDANHDAALEAGEGGLGISGLYVKLQSDTSGTCSSTASAESAVNPTTGAYSIPSVAPGNYCLTLSNAASLSSNTPYVPSGWVGTQNASAQEVVYVGGASSIGPQNFGFFHGAKASGTTFLDNGQGSATANDGVQESSEPGMGGIVVAASSAGKLLDQETSDGSGNFTVWLPAGSTPVSIAPKLPTGYTATAGSAGTTTAAAGTYAANAVTFSPVAGTAYSGLAFGMVAPNTFTASASQTGSPGSAVFYPAQFVAQTSGVVSFATSAVAAPASLSWTEQVYLDSGCTGQISSQDAPVGSVSVVQGQRVCVLLKENIPVTAQVGDTNAVTLSALFTYATMKPALQASLAVLDQTTAGATGALSLTKMVRDLTTGMGPAVAIQASPGDSLQYTLQATNNSAQALASVAISDTTPAYTGFVSASCPQVLSSTITSCQVAQAPAAGAQGTIQWVFSGSLPASAQISVSYVVQVSH
jgi:uncharacterized repeat protein (TIGR01451 family)